MAINSLERVVGTLGSGVVDVISSPQGLDVEIGDLVVLDPADPIEVSEGDLVLGVGLGPGAETAEIVSELASRNVAAVMLKASAADPDLLEAVEGLGIAILSVPTGASWSQIIHLIQSVLSHSTSGDEAVGSSGDLFALADAIAALVDAPVTIEDRLSRVLAYSARQEEADAARAETIVGRRVPERLVRKLEEKGLFRRLRDETACVFVSDMGPDVLPRLAVGIRAGGEMLGSIWAAVPERPDPETERAFFETSKVAALHLLRHRAGTDVERNLQADLLASVLQGSAGADEATVRLGLSGATYCVAAAWLTADDEAEADRARTQLRDLLAVHMSTFRVRGAAAVLGGIVYAVFGTDDGTSQQRAVRVFEDLLSRGARGLGPSVGIGAEATDLVDVPRSKREAEEALRVARAHPERSIATIEQVGLPALLARFSEAAQVDRAVYGSKVEPLVRSDADDGTAYIAALRAYFDAFGDYTAAAAALHIHPNTLRYRLGRAQQIAEVRLDDPEERLALMLLVRLLDDPVDITK
jgi:hypothetical protein